MLFILTDQQSATMMGCTGNRYVHTPAMDSLAAEGVRFDRAYCTNPVCVPSRFSLMTGRMPGAIGMLGNRTADLGDIPEHVKSSGLGHLLRRAGYDAGYAGKVHLPKMSAADVGFEYVCPDERDALPEACAQFINRPRDRPFFLVASLINPHDICYMAIRDFAGSEQDRWIIDHGALECATLDAALARPAGIDEEAFYTEHCPPLPPNFEPQADEPEAIRIMLQQRPFRIKARRQWSARRWREHRWAYARLTEMVDRQIGRLLGALRDSGQMDRTFVVFTSDHGDMDASHRMEHKSMLYEETCRIPLIIRPPGGQSPGRVDQAHLVSNGLDLLPTFCDWAGTCPPSDLKGRSLRRLVETASDDTWRRSLPVECVIGRAIITDRFKYSRYDVGSSAEQLTDLACDPHEQKNSLHDHQNQPALAELRALWQETFGSQPRRPADVLSAAFES